VPLLRKGVVRTEQLSEEEMDTLLKRIDRIIRWNHFLTHNSINAHKLIDSITGDTPLDRDSAALSELHYKALEDTRTYKNKTLAQFEVCL
jgi:hypothetical protein